MIALSRLRSPRTSFPPASTELLSILTTPSAADSRNRQGSLCPADSSPAVSFFIRSASLATNWSPILSEQITRSYYQLGMVEKVTVDMQI